MVADKASGARPLHRILARLLDSLSGALLLKPVVELLYLLFPSQVVAFLSVFDPVEMQERFPFFQVLVLGYGWLLLSMLFNTLSLLLFGNSFGKYLFGMRLYIRNGGWFTFSAGLWREILVYMRGCGGVFIPLISEVFMMVQIYRLRKGKNLLWDGDRYEMIYRPYTALQYCKTLTGVIILLACCFFLMR